MNIPHLQYLSVLILLIQCTFQFHLLLFSSFFPDELLTDKVIEWKVRVCSITMRLRLIHYIIFPIRISRIAVRFLHLS